MTHGTFSNRKICDGIATYLTEKCEIGWTWYGKEFQGTGLNSACKYELLKFGFEKIGFRRIQFSADEDSIRSQRAIEKLGAIKEGVFRNNFLDQLSKVKEILPKITIDSEVVDGIKSYRINAKSSLVVLSGKIITKVIPNLEDTAHIDSYLYHSLTSLFSLKLKDNEIITELKTNLNFQGNSIESAINVIDIKNITDNTDRFDYLCNFSHEKN